MKKIYVTKSFLPPIDEYKGYIDKIWQSGQLTNEGPILKDFESRVAEYLGIPNIQAVSNGTVALQLALNALGITEGEIITTPFSYVATTSAILWERCQPVYVDIDPRTLNIDPTKIEASITENTRAILAVHVFGNPCDVEAIEKIAKKNNLKVIYDAAHAFGVRYGGKSLLAYGDVSTCSFHATKLFHTIEGGGIFATDKRVEERIELRKRFGHDGDEHHTLGINAKMSEFNAAMGLCNIKYIEEIIQSRKRLSELYDRQLNTRVRKQQISARTDYNYSYYPVLFENEKQLLFVLKKLNSSNIFPRRYFFPSLNRLPYLDSTARCTISEDISARILCLPLYPNLDDETVNKVCEVINNA